MTIPCSPTAYVGCTPPTTIITHAPHVVQHLAFTGAGGDLLALAWAGAGAFVIGGSLIAFHFIDRLRVRP